MNEKQAPSAPVDPKYEIHQANWEGIDLVVSHCRAWLGSRSDFQIQHIEVRSAEFVALPITETGYRSIFLNGSEALFEYQNDPVNYVLSYIRHKAKTKEWKKHVEQRRQPDLFG